MAAVGELDAAPQRGSRGGRANVNESGFASSLAPPYSAAQLAFPGCRDCPRGSPVAPALLSYVFRLSANPSAHLQRLGAGRQRKTDRRVAATNSASTTTEG